jgi:Protein of unknown function (DUF3999)
MKIRRTGNAVFCIGACALFAQLTAVQALTRAEYALDVPVRSTDNQALISVDLPFEVYSASRKPALGDLRVVNSAGEAVPFALGLAPIETTQGASKSLALMPFYAASSASVASTDGVTLTKLGDQLSLVISPKASKSAPGQVLKAYYADLRELAEGSKAPLVQSLNLNLQAGADLSAALMVETSDDLKSWRTIAQAAPVFRLSRSGQVLSNTLIEFTSTPIRYLRLSSPNGGEPIALVDVTVKLASKVAVRPLQWVVLEGVAAPALSKEVRVPKNTFDYDAGVGLPITRINLNFADPNTLAPVKVLARRATDQAWENLQSETMYRMNMASGEARNTDVLLRSSNPNYRYWQVQIDERAGEFASKVPKLRLGFAPARLVFTARGSPPFAVLIGNAQAEPLALSMNSLVPGNQEGAGLGSALSSLDLTQAVRREGMGPKVIDRSAEQRKQWILWGLLIAGVGTLAVFALKLLKEPGKEAS